jgi:hypothetical protein
MDPNAERLGRFPILEPGDVPPSPDERLAAGQITVREHAESVELGLLFDAKRRSGWRGTALTLPEARRDPRFRAALDARLRTGSSRTRRPRRRGAGRPGGTRRSSRSGESSDSEGGSSDDDDAAHLRGFLVDLIGFPWPEALIDRAYGFSVEIERQVTS